MAYFDIMDERAKENIFNLWMWYNWLFILEKQNSIFCIFHKTELQMDQGLIFEKQFLSTLEGKILSNTFMKHIFQTRKLHTDCYIIRSFDH